MGKGSSPLMSGAKTIGFSFAKPKLKASKMSFVRAKKAKAIKAEDLKGQETISTGSLATTLTETNRILVEIQNQLAIDFANRIAEKKQTLKLSRKTVRKKKLGEKEQFVERGVKLQKSANTFTKKVLAPVKGIFDKILDFLSFVGGGILLNSAWNWLKDENNRKNLVKIFQFLKTYWKEILIGLLTAKVIGAIAKLVGFARTLRRLFNRLKGLGRRPPGSGGTTPGSNKGGPPGGCGPVTGKGGCLDQLSATSSVANRLAQTLFATAFATNYFKKFIPNAEPVKAPAPLQQPAEQEATAEAEQQTQTPAPTVIPLKSFTGKEIPKELYVAVEALQREYNKTKKDQSLMTEYGFLQVKATARNRLGILGGPDLTPRIHFNPNLTPKTNAEAIAAAEALFTIANLPATLAPVISARGAIGRSINSASKRGSLGAYRPPGGFTRPSKSKTPDADRVLGRKTNTKKSKSKLSPADIKWKNEIDARAREIMGDARLYNKEDRVGTRQRMLDIYGNDNAPLVDRAAARTILIKKSRNGGFDVPETEVPKVIEGFNPLQAAFSKLESGQTLTPFDKNLLKSSGYEGSFSKGGTVFGQGSQTVDSVPAMLAPGEEVIRSASANIFRPVLKDINDNAGRMFVAFRDGVNLMKRNNDLQTEETERSIKLFGEFNDVLEKEYSRVRQEQFAKLVKGSMLVSNIPHQQSESPFQLMSNNTVEQPLPQQTIRVIHTESDPSLNQYGHRRTPKEGKIETLSMNMAPNVIDLSQKQQQPKEQPKESSATDIIISPVDPDNPFFGRTFTSLGVEL